MNTQQRIDSFHGAYRFLSNFWFSDVQVVWAGRKFVAPTVEHGYQASKAILPDDFLSVIFASSPLEAKRMGRKIRVRTDWDEIKLGVMEDLLRQKFQSPGFREMLIATGDAELVEGNTWGDTYWGQCNGVGENHLGKLLMQIRTELRNI